MRTLFVLGCLLIALGAAFAPARAECGEFSHLGADCVGENSARVYWLAAIDISCDDHHLTLERKCGPGPWVTIADSPTSPYVDSEMCGALATRYRLKLTCFCDGQFVTTYSAEIGPIRCPGVGQP
jgi:hypothetical protein